MSLARVTAWRSRMLNQISIWFSHEACEGTRSAHDPAEPRATRGSPGRVNRQAVQDDHQATPGVAGPERLEQFEELAPTPSASHARQHAARPNMEASQNRKHAVAPVVLLLACRPARTRGASRMQALENLHLGFLVHTHDVGAPGRPQVPADHAADFESEIGIRTVQPPADSVGLEGGALQPSPDRALADGAPQVAPRPRGLGERTQRPMRPGRRQFGEGMAGERDHLMLLFRGKTSRAARIAEHRPARPAARVRTVPANAAPICDRAQHAERCRTRFRPGRGAGQPARGPRPTIQSVRSAATAGVRFVRLASVAAAQHAVRRFSCAAGYLTVGLPWGRTFGTRH